MNDPRYTLIRISQDTQAVVDSQSGAYYGLAECEPAWGARDWQGLSLNLFFTETRVPAARSTFQWWAERLIERAEHTGGLPVPEDPELASGLSDGFLFLPGGTPEQMRFNVYTEDGRHLGAIRRDESGRWVSAHRPGAPGPEVAEATRAKAASVLAAKS